HLHPAPQALVRALAIDCLRSRSKRLLLVLFAGALIQQAASAGAAPGVRSLVEISDIDGLAVSPDGHDLAFRTVRADIERNSYDLNWHSADLQRHAVATIGGAGAPIYQDPGLIEAEVPLWAPDGHSIIFRALVDGAIGVWKAGVDGQAAVPLIVRDE